MVRREVLTIMLLLLLHPLTHLNVCLYLGLRPELSLQRDWRLLMSQIACTISPWGTMMESARILVGIDREYVHIQFSSVGNDPPAAASSAASGERLGSPFGQAALGCAKAVAKLLKPSPGIGSAKDERVKSGDARLSVTDNNGIGTSGAGNGGTADGKVETDGRVWRRTGESKGLYSFSTLTLAGSETD